MKIKTWLLLTYFLVMLLPLVGVYGLYLSITGYYQDKNVAEYFEKWGELHIPIKLTTKMARFKLFLHSN